MESFFNMVDVQTVLFIYMAVGFFCRKVRIFTDEARDKLTDFVVLVTLPCMIFESFHMAFSLETLKQGAASVAIALVMACVALLLGKVLYNRFPYEEKSILQYGTLVSNSGFAGLPVVSGAYGDRGSSWAPCSSSPPASSCGAPVSPCSPRPTPRTPSRRS